ncbi:BPSL0761 family protein [Paraburkholderia bannensis]|uniref:BPSL0761 family protein n=1 Tax=Paraburkholderia bannensis TaxID=765414 RepID=UPI002AB6B086|nr:BPSL0761 family protein [Paraburkholderia bannensis]
MTTPSERTKSVRGARVFLETLAGHTDCLNPLLVRTLAIQLLRHFPSDADIEAFSNLLPMLWGSAQTDDSQAAVREADGPGLPSLISARRGQL